MVEIKLFKIYRDKQRWKIYKNLNRMSIYYW